MTAASGEAARCAERKTVVQTAQCWFDAARKARVAGNHSDATLYMENAFNHTENALAALLSRVSSLGNRDARAAADKAMHEIWSGWFTFYERHFRGPGIVISMADQQAFHEIAQPTLHRLAAALTPAAHVGLPSPTGGGT